MRFGIIGFGRIARKFCQSITYSDHHLIVAIASKSVKKDDTYVLQHPEIKIYQDYEVMLEDADIDAVYIALPHKFHYEWILKALRHHKAVLCEKPAVLNTAEMIQIKETAITERTFFLEALKTKLNRGFIRLMDDLPLIGQLQKIEANFCFDATKMKGNSYLFEPVQGGALNDVGSYLIGFTLKLVEANVKTLDVISKMVDGIDEYFQATLVFENDVTAILEGAINQNKERYAHLKGSMGEIRIPMFNRISEYTITLYDGTVISRHEPILGDDMTYQINEMGRCVQEHRLESPLHSLDEMIEVTKMTEQIRNRFKG